MRVLHIIDSLTPAGAERSLAAMAPHLVEAGVELHVGVLVDRPGLRGAIERSRGQVHRLDGPGGRVRRMGRTRSLVGSLRPDIVHTTLFESDIAGRWAGWRTGTPVVSSLVNEAYGPAQRRAPGIRAHRLAGAQLADALSARVVDRFHSVSETVADAMARRLRISRTRIEVIPRGREPETLGTRSTTRRLAARHSLGVEEDEVLILGIGRHEHQKGFDVLIDALPLVLREVGPARLLIAGREGGASPELRARAVRAGGAIELLGPRDDVAELLCAADVLAFPSRWEGMPGTLLEAMALETPIVASDIPAVREVLPDDSFAELALPNDADALGRAIVRVLGDEAVRCRRARTSRARFLELYTVRSASSAMVRLYEHVLAR